VLNARERLIAEAAALAAPFDAWLMPTVAITAPAIAPLEADDELYNRVDYQVLRNTSVMNFLDGCALTIPCHEPWTAPVGLTVAGQGGEDRRILAIGLAVEAVLQR
jgi:aspartyl-tRNA(Asn)/glutamyl-tRNA(Gln) amidotransferase subunit A